MHCEPGRCLCASFSCRVRARGRVGPAGFAGCRRQPERRPLHTDGREDHVEQWYEQQDRQPHELDDGASVVTASQRGSSSACPVTCTVGPTGRNQAISGSRTSAETLTTGTPSMTSCCDAATAWAYDAPSARAIKALARCAPSAGSATSALAPYLAPSATLAARTLRTW